MEDRSPQVLAIAVTFFVTCWLAVSLRVYCRACVIKSFGADDWLLVVLQLVFTVYLVSQIVAWHYGTGKHRSVLTNEENSRALLFWFVCELLYIFCTCLLKVSVGVFLLRITVDLKHVWALRLLTVFTVLFGTIYFFLVVFQCNPPSTFWTQSPRAPGLCMGKAVVLSMTYTSSALNCIADWIFGGFLPLIIVRSLNMPRRTKVLVACILGFAAIGSAGTVVRMFYIHKLLSGDDFLFETTDVALWSTIEPGIGIVAISVAALRPLRHCWRHHALDLSGGPLPGGYRSWPDRPSNRSDRSDPTADGNELKTWQPAPSLRPDYHWFHSAAAASGPSASGHRHSPSASASLLDMGGRAAELAVEKDGITKTTEVTLSANSRLSLCREDEMWAAAQQQEEEGGGEEQQQQQQQQHEVPRLPRCELWPSRARRPPSLTGRPRFRDDHDHDRETAQAAEDVGLVSGSPWHPRLSPIPSLRSPSATAARARNRWSLVSPRRSRPAAPDTS